MPDNEGNKFEYAWQQAIDALFFYLDEEELKKKSSFIDGKKLAYIEIFSALQSAMEVNDIPLKEFGLDFDVDNMFAND